MMGECKTDITRTRSQWSYVFLALTLQYHGWLCDPWVSLLFAGLSSLWQHSIPDNKVHEANMGPIWGRQDPGGPHVGPMNFSIWDVFTLTTPSRAGYWCYWTHSMVVSLPRVQGFWYGFVSVCSLTYCNGNFRFTRVSELLIIIL